VIQTSIAASDYEGWVAWIDDTPIFEHVEYNPKLLPLISDASHLEFREKAHNVLEWKELPHDKLTRVELYFCRKKYPGQPAWRCDREPGLEMRFIQMKLGSITIATDRVHGGGQHRTGVVGYRVGLWIPSRKECKLWEINRSEIIYMGEVSDPCAPRPTGFGFAPHVIGRKTA
jgi:hypothetical protein